MASGNENEDYHGYAVHLKQEHRRLGEFLNRVKRRWNELPQHRSPAKALAQIVADLEALRGELARHFEEEESGGCMEEAVADRIERQHPELLRQLDALVERLRGTAPVDESIRDQEAEFDRFAKRLRAHEAAENRILEAGFGMDPD
jgi:hypothetical protein